VVAGAVGLCILLGIVTAQRHRVWRSAEEFWWDIICNAPEKARAYNNYGVALAEKGKFTEAIEYYKKAITMDRRYPDPCNNLAVSFSALGQVDNAISAIKMSIKLQPRYPENYNNLASFLMQKGDLENGEKVLLIALQLRPHYGKALLNLARLYTIQKKYDKAYEALHNCCTKSDLDNSMASQRVALEAYGDMSVRCGKFETAAFAYERLVHMDATHARAAKNLIPIYTKLGRYEQAHSLVKSLMAHHTADALFLHNAGDLYYVQKEYAEALKWYRQAARLNPEGPALANAAHCLEKLGQPLEASRLRNALRAKKQ
jgi:tetratricopeptide (TPR) repeat protein